MAQIVLVHGIAQEQRSADELEALWIPSLAGGLRNAGQDDLADRIRDYTIRMAFYGNKFLKDDHQGLEPDPLTEEEEATAEAFAKDLLKNATYSSDEEDADEARISLLAMDPEVADAQSAFSEAKVRAVGWLDKLPWFGRGVVDAAGAIKPTLAQVTKYLEDAEIHDFAVGKVTRHMGEDTQVVIGHSLGSVVAYDAVRALPADQTIPLLITLGSPLGLSAISTRLKPQLPGFPAAVKKWVNIAAPDDIVAARPDLHEAFDRDRPTGAEFPKTWVVDNGSEPHDIKFYLSKQSCGNTLASALEGIEPLGRR
jgi:hypothetical protein